MKTHEELKKEVKALIGDNKTAKALKLLTSQSLPPYDKEIVLINSRYSKLKDEQRLGISDESDIQRKYNKINFDLLALVEAIGANTAITNNTTGTGDGGSKSSTNKILFFVGGILLALLVGWGAMQMTSGTKTDNTKPKKENPTIKKPDGESDPSKNTRTEPQTNPTAPPPVVTTPTETDVKIELGMEYGGGIVFYIDPTNNKRGLIMAPNDILDEELHWHGNEVRPEKTGAFRTSIFGGKKNTEAIVQKYGNGHYPAKLCYDYEFGGQTDWYLPSQEELNELYRYDNHAGFEKSYYWSSTEISNKDVYYRSFHNGKTYTSLPKQNSYKNQNKARVRAIRSF